MSALKFRKGNLPLYFSLFLLQYVLLEAKCGAFVENRTCGTLYSGSQLDGDSFTFKDFDQSVNLRTDYRNFNSGRWNTNSIQLQDNCSMTICTETYFQGHCQNISGSGHQDILLSSPPRSFNCTCSRECSCDDIQLPLSEDTCGRAYLNASCNTCDAEYVQLYNNQELGFPDVYRDSVKSIVLQTGCKLIAFTDLYHSKNRNLITGTTSDHQGRLGSYRCYCDDGALTPETPTLKYPIISLQDILNNDDDAITNHPGLTAARKSMENNRSSANAFILVIGTADLPWWGNGYFRWNNGKQFGEAQFPIDLEELGITDSSLRIIYANIAKENYTKPGRRYRHRDEDESNDAIWAASLEKYLSNHQELASVLPNAVIIYHTPLNVNTDSAVDSNSRFLRKVRLVNSLRGKILDEDYSNLIFLFEDLADVT